MSKKGNIPWNKGKKGLQDAWNKGICHTQETKEKISRTIKQSGKFKGDLNPSKRPEVRAKISKALKGRKVPWLKGKKRPEHSKFMKENIRYFLNLDNNFGRGNADLFKCLKGHSKLHDKIKNIIVSESNVHTFESEKRIDMYIYDEVDFYNKVIIEVNGDIFHANPKLYNKNDFPHPFEKISAKEMWDRDNKKIKYAENLGFKVVVIWEDFIKKSDNTAIKNFLLREIGVL